VGAGLYATPKGRCTGLSEPGGGDGSPAGSDGSHDLQTEMFFHREKIAVVMQQRVAIFDAERADGNVGGFADRDADLPQLTIIPRGARDQVGVQERYDGKLAQAAFNARGMSLIPGALKNFEKNEITNQKRLVGGRFSQFDRRRRPIATQVRDPD